MAAVNPPRCAQHKTAMIVDPTAMPSAGYVVMVCCLMGCKQSEILSTALYEEIYGKPPETKSG